MATALEELFIEIKTKGTKAVKTSLQGMRKVIKSLVGDIKVFKANLAAIAVTGLFKSAISGVRVLSREFKELIGSSIELAATQEAAELSLVTAMKTAGDFSKEAIKDLIDFSSAMQDISVNGDEAVLSQLALAKAYGATNEQAKLIVEASIEMAAATGKSLQTAVEQTAKTLGGFGGELSEINPLIKELTVEQLKAGDAAKILLKQYGGSAAKNIKSFTGQTIQLGNVWGDMKELIGAPLLEVILPAIKSLRSELKGMAPEFSRFGQQLASAFGVVNRIIAAFGGSGAILKTGLDAFGTFVLDMALLIEDLFFFIRGEESALGAILGTTGGGFGALFEGLSVKIGEAIGPALVSALTFIGDLLLNIGDGLVSSITEGLRKFFVEDFKAMAKLAFAELPSLAFNPIGAIAGSVASSVFGGGDSNNVSNTNNNQKSTVINQDIKITTSETVNDLKRELDSAAQEVKMATKGR